MLKLEDQIYTALDFPVYKFQKLEYWKIRDTVMIQVGRHLPKC